MTDKPVWWYLCLAALAVVLLAMPHLGSAHPLGNFSISHYTAIRLDSDAVVLRYLIDMAEIPTFQEIQDTQIVLQEGHPSLPAYLAQRVDDLRAGLILELNGVRLPLSSESSMDQQSFEQAVLTVLRQIPEQQRMSILKIVQTLVREHLKSEAAGHRSQSYSIEHHREIQRLTASIRGSLAEAVVTERDERG